MKIDLLPESATAPAAARRRYFWRNLGTGVLVAASLLVLVNVNPGAGAGAAAFVVFCLALFVGCYEFFRLMTALDEMQRRIHITALALSGAAVAFLATVSGVAAIVFSFPPPLAAFGLPAVGLTYYLALAGVARRYT
ncbi:MAG: hypothetical protein ACOC20_03630 [Oceanicaulis sp.]